jgi:hypothetical protein
MQSCSDWRLELIERTHIHWEHGSSLTATEEYIETLLPDELRYAQQCLNLKQSDDCDTLVLLLGFSFDPLLQSIWAYQPRRIVLICNYEYAFGDEDDPSNILSGQEWARQFRTHIIQLRQQGLFQAQTLPNFDPAEQTGTANGDIAISNSEASPDWVFRQLCKRIIPRRREATAEEPQKKVVVDISGAKKNMMAGAFLFADYAGARISYVDFDEYDPVKRRPYGFTCRIGEQPNPYRVLSLRDWTRVRNLYEHFFFRAAAEEVTVIEQRMRVGINLGNEQVRYFDSEQCNAVKLLAHVLRLLELWDNGDHTGAWELWSQPAQDGGAEILPPLGQQAPKFDLPVAVEQLGSEGWPSSKTADANALYQMHRKFKLGHFWTNDAADRSVFERVDILLCYASDELAKIIRLIDFNEDYRSAFLRAAALDELLLKARIALLWLHDKLLIDGQNKANPLNRAQNQSFVYLGNASSADKFRDFLLDRHETLTVGPYRDRKSLGRRNDLTEVWEMEPYWRYISNLDHERMIDLRGEAIHTHLSLPDKTARAAHAIAAAGLYDFVTNWVNRLGANEELPPPWEFAWENLCHACGVTFLPPTPEEESP